MSLILAAAAYAKQVHRDQKRKYNGLPYITHPARVAGQVSLIEGVTEEIVAAAWLHDVIEDCGSAYVITMSAVVPEQTMKLVHELTNEKHYGPNKPGRSLLKAADRNRLKTVSTWAKRIKLIDRMDNVRELVATCPDLAFKNTYLDESLLLANAIYDPFDPVNKTLYLELMTELAMSLLCPK